MSLDQEHAVKDAVAEAERHGNPILLQKLSVNGFVSRSLRRAAWPAVLRVNTEDVRLLPNGSRLPLTPLAPQPPPSGRSVATCPERASVPRRRRAGRSRQTARNHRKVQHDDDGQASAPHDLSVSRTRRMTAITTPPCTPAPAPVPLPPPVVRSLRACQAAQGNAHHPAYSHPYANQILLDANRAFHFRDCLRWSEDERHERVQALGCLLHRVFLGMSADEAANAHYYQGLHDIASVMMLVLGQDLAVPSLRQLMRVHLRGHVTSDMTLTVDVLGYLFPLVSATDPDLANFLEESNVQPFFALSWIITWFAHSQRHLDPLFMLFDLFISSHALLPLYYAASVITYLRDEVMQLECDPASIHQFFQQLPDPLPIALLTPRCLALFEKLPPPKLFLLEPSAGSCMGRILKLWPELQQEARIVPVGAPWTASSEAAMEKDSRRGFSGSNPLCRLIVWILWGIRAVFWLPVYLFAGVLGVLLVLFWCGLLGFVPAVARAAWATFVPGFGEGGS